MRLEDDFEDKMTEALVDATAEKLMSDIIPRMIQQSHDVLEAYGSRNDYNVQPVIDSLQEPELEKRDGGLTVTWGWEHEAAPYFEWGTSAHTVEGNPILSWVWEDPPDWVKEQFEREGSGYRVFFTETEPSGIPEARFARAALDFLREEAR